MLLAAVAQACDAHPGDNVATVVRSSSQARHPLVGSIAVNLIRCSQVPLVIVP